MQAPHLLSTRARQSKGIPSAATANLGRWMQKPRLGPRGKLPSRRRGLPGAQRQKSLEAVPVLQGPCKGYSQPLDVCLIRSLPLRPIHHDKLIGLLPRGLPW